MAHDTTKKGVSKKRRSRKGLLGINDIMQKTVSRLQLKSQFDEYNIRKHYKSIFGNDIAKISHPEKLIKGSLYIVVSSSAWLMQLSFMKDEFKKKINEYFNKRYINNITFKVGRLSEHVERVPPVRRLSLGKIRLDEMTKSAIKESVKEIKDSSLKRCIIAAETAYYKRKKSDNPQPPAKNNDE